MKQLARRSLGIFLSLMMLLTAMPSAFALENDIKGHWAEEALQSFANDGYLAGDGKGHYTPNATMTRAQFATILNRLTGLTEESAAITNYTDVSESDWYYHELAKALAAGFMSGTSATTMSPNAPITRQQAFTMLARYLNLDTSDTSALASFADQDTVADYAKGSVAAMVTAGYVQGVGDGKLLPEKQLTRAEGVTVLYRSKTALQAVTPSVTVGYKDGVYIGTGAGYGGTVKVQMTVSGGKITNLEILSHSETSGYLNRAKKLLDTILEKQGTDGVDTVSGATKSSNGLLTAINACISQAQGGADTSKTGSTGGGGGGTGASTKPEGEDFSGALKDGTYTGSASGYSGTTKVTVTVSGGKITNITIDSHGDTSSYFNSAKGVISKMIEKQSTDVDAVSGATYSSWGIINAVADALKTAVPTVAKTYQVANWKEFTTALAKAKDGDTIQLTGDIIDAGQVDAVSSATATVNKSVTIDGKGKAITAYGDKVTKTTTAKDGTVTSEKVNATFCFDVTTAAGIQIKDLTIDGASFSHKLGGAMYVEEGAEVTLTGVTFKNCAAGNTGDGNGGAAIYAKGASSTVTAENCTFKNNKVNGGSTGRGGAVYGYNANITLKNCTFAGNSAAFGSAVAAAGSTNLTVTGCAFGEGTTTSSARAVDPAPFIYIFDGYTPYKKGKIVDSAVRYDISGNKDSSNAALASERIVIGRVLGKVDEKTYVGSGNPVFLPGKDMRFNIATDDGKARTGTPTSTTEANSYVTLWMNIPYTDFYAAELNNRVNVDAVSSATKNKTRTGSLVSGSYHKDNTGADISGITFPVVMSATDFESFRSGKTEITGGSSVSITVTNRGNTSTITYNGKDALFESASYSYYKLTDTDTMPSYYKVASYVDSKLTFSKVQGVSTALSSVKASLQTKSSYGDYQINLMDDSGTISADRTVYGVILSTREGNDYGLRHLENIWRGTELAFCTGFTTSVHNSPTSSAHYEAIMGQTITQITYLTNTGIYTIDCELYVPVKFNGVLSVANADASAGTTAVSSSGFPVGYAAKISVANGSGEDVTNTYGFALTGSTLTWTGAPAVGAYTLTVSDASGVYAPYSAGFELQTAVLPATYDSSTLSLKTADGATAEQLANYLSSISAVKVGNQSYSASGRGAVTVINKNGFINLNAKSGNSSVFSDLAAGKTYEITVTAAGYSAPLTFTVTIPETIYAYASLTYAEYWAGEDVSLSGNDMTASSSEADRTYTQGKGDNSTTYYEYDKGAFDAVTRATTNHGLHRGSFQQAVKITGSDTKTYAPLYWVDGNNFVAADGRTYNKNEIGMTSYEITGIKYVPVAVSAANYQDFCKAYTVTQNGEALAGGYSEQQLKAYQEVAFVTASTNGLKAATLNGSEWSFSARTTNTESGILGQALTTAENVTSTVKSSSQFGDFLRVDLNGDGYGALGSMMQTVVWKYYGSGDTVLSTYGTKFAADNWMHKSMGIQLGLTESLRCKLPEGTDGTGKWTVTVYALGYADYTFTVDVQPGDLHGSKALAMTEEQKTQLENLKSQAAALIPADYPEETASEALKALKEHYDEAVALLNNENATYAEAEELINELPSLIANASAT